MVKIKNNYNKKNEEYDDLIDSFKVGKDHEEEELSRAKHFENQVILWTAYYRENPHRFVKDFLNIDLKLFQVILLWAMMHHNVFMFIGSRGIGKSFLSAIFLIVRCILYPESKIVIAAGVKTQSINVLLKIQDEILPRAPLLKREIAEIKTSHQDPVIRFHNGSWIRVVAATDSARSLRANIILVDEFRMVKKEIVDTVLRKFLTSSRKPGYLRLPEYVDYPEEPNKELYLSSAWYKHHWSYTSMMDYTKKMISGARYFVAHLPYQIGIFDRIYNKERIYDEMSEENFNEITWMMEMEAKWFGESERAYFKYKDLESNRNEPVAFYPQDTLDLTGNVLSNPKKQRERGELRILGVDIAVLGGSENDASVFSVLQLIPNGKHYQRNVVYLESMEGSHSELQAIRIQKLRHDFDIDYIAFDARTVGIAVMDALMTPLYDEETGEKYEPITVIDNDNKYAERCQYANAERVIFPILATKEMNMEIATIMSDSLGRGRINLLSKEQSAVERLRRIKKLNYYDLDPRVTALLKLPHVQTELLTHEMLNLEMVHDDSGFKLVEQGRMRKDRYTSVSYANYYASIPEKQNLLGRTREGVDVSKFAVFRKPKF